MTTAKKKVNNFLYEELTYKVRGVIFNIRKNLGSGHKEIVYQKAGAAGLEKAGISYIREARINVLYENKVVGIYMPDFIIDDKIIMEIKAKPFLHKKDIEQFWHYLKGNKYKLGLLVNFGFPEGVQIIRRIN